MSFNLRSKTMSIVEREQTTIFHQELLDRGWLDIERIAYCVATCDRYPVGAILMYNGKGGCKGAGFELSEFQVNLWEISGWSLVDRGDWSARLSYAHNVPRFHDFPVRSLHNWFWTAPLVAQDSFALPATLGIVCASPACVSTSLHARAPILLSLALDRPQAPSPHSLLLPNWLGASPQALLFSYPL